MAPAVVLYAAIGLSHWSILPAWDAWFYSNCLVDGLRGPGLSLWNCAAHPTGGYFGLLAVPYRLLHSNYAAVVVVNVILGALAIHAVGDLSARMYPGRESAAERVLVALACALSPVFLACTVQLTPDFGVAVFSVLTIRCLAAGNLRLAVLTGALASFSKETGVGIYLVAVAACAITQVDWAAASRADRLGALRRFAMLLVVPAALGLYLLVRTQVRSAPVGWGGLGAHLSPWRYLLSINFTDNVLPTQLAEIFVVNFSWVLLPFIALAALKTAGAAFVRWLLGQGAPGSAPPDSRAVWMTMLSFVGVVFAVTRLRTWVIPRYVLPAILLLPLVAQVSLRALDVRRRMREGLLAIFVLLSALSVSRTRDGVSMSLFGTFEFGRHRMLDMGRPAMWSGGGEQVVYNLEFAQLGRLLREAMPRVAAGGGHAIAFHSDESHHGIGWIDRRTGRLGPYRPDSYHPHVWTLREIRGSADRPPLVYYLEFPGREDEDELIGWSRFYDRVGSTRYARDGYVMMVRELRLRR